MRERGIPYVLCLLKGDDDSSVSVNDLLGGRLAAEHLATAGQKDVAVVSPGISVSTGRERVEGFLDGVREHGVQVDPSKIVPAGFDLASGQRAAEVILGWARLPTAIFACNDLTAAGLMFRFREAGVEVGRDLAVIGYNDIEIAQHLPVPLTSVASPLHETGSQSVGMLIDLIGGKDGPGESHTATGALRVDTRLPLPTLSERHGSDRAGEIVIADVLHREAPKTWNASMWPCRKASWACVG